MTLNKRFYFKFQAFYSFFLNPALRLVLIHSVPSCISSPSGYLVATVGGFPRFLTLQF